jgi:hypothetical protein
MTLSFERTLSFIVQSMEVLALTLWTKILARFLSFLSPKTSLALWLFAKAEGSWRSFLNKDLMILFAGLNNNSVFAQINRN